MYGIQDKINQILRGAETIRKNQSMKPLQPVNSTTTFFAGKEPQTPDSDVARLREEANNWHQHYRDEASKAQKCKQAFIEQEKEVARLREEIEIERKRVTAGWDEIARLREVCEWAAYMMDGISPARGQEIRDASQKPHNQ
jgi:hypothetical protein